MSLDPRITRCLGQHYSGEDCARMESCQRYTARNIRGDRPAAWSLCTERDGVFPFQIKPEPPAAPASATLTPAQVAQMEEACAASDRLTLPVRGEVG